MLELKNINAGYNSFQALFDVSLSVKAGEAVAVIGPNGAGKSTLLRVISRLIEATAGSMQMQGQSYRDLPSHKVVGLGIAQVPEGRRLFPRLSVEDNLKIGAYTPAARAKLQEPSAGLAPVIVQSIFELMHRIRAEGYTVLIVEQNIQQVLKVVDRAYLLEIGKIRASGTAAELLSSDEVQKAYLGV